MTPNDSYLSAYISRSTHLGSNPQTRAFNSGILEFRRNLKYNQHTQRGLYVDGNPQDLFDGVILTDKQDENRVSQILTVELDVPIKVGDLIMWNEDRWLVYRSTTSSYQPYQKFYMVRCNHFIKWIDEEGKLQSSWIYLLGSKDSKIKDNFRTWNEMITPQPNKHINIILPRTHIRRETEIIILGEAWRLVDYDQNSVDGISFMSFTESKINEQRDDIEEAVANIDTKAQWLIEVAAERQVSVGEVFEPVCNVLKNGITTAVEPIIEVDLADWEVIDNKYVKAGFNWPCTITFKYDEAIAQQIVKINRVPKITTLLTGNDKIRVGNSADYIVESIGEVEFSISPKTLATLKVNPDNPKQCTVYANENNKLGTATLTITDVNGEILTKEIQIVSLWQVI